MDALGLFLLRYDAIHGGFVEELFAGLTDDQVRQEPQADEKREPQPDDRQGRRQPISTGLVHAARG